MALFRYPGVTGTRELTQNLKPAVLRGRKGDEPGLGGAVGWGVMFRALLWSGHSCPTTSLSPLIWKGNCHFNVLMERWSRAGSEPHGRAGQHGGAEERIKPASSCRNPWQEKSYIKIKPMGVLYYISLPPP